jgi:hypothetical protein
MARKKMSIITTLLLLAQLLAFTGGSVSFEGGQNEAIVSLTTPGFEATINIDVPAGNYVTNATMKVTGMASENNASAYPEGVTIKLNESTIWAFQQTGFGPLGRQNQFSAGQKMVNSSFGGSGGINTQYIRLPKDATVQSATMEVRGIPPTIGQELVNFTGNAAGDALGVSVCNAGDVNGDGYDDVLVGASGNDSGGDNVGQTYLYYGGPDMDNIADVTMTGNAPSDGFGYSVSSAGDVNNDGYDDILVCGGRQYIGQAYLFYGGQNMDNVADVIFTNMSYTYCVVGSCSGAGDVNGDGYDDVIVGNSHYWSGGMGTGAAYIYYGGANMDNVSDLFLTKESPGYFGWSVSDAGDVNNDGYDDVIVGAFTHEDNYTGSVYVYFGGKNMDNMSDVIINEIEGIGGFFGDIVSDAGDVNNDGYDDVLIWDMNFIGRGFLYFGGSNMDNVTDVNFTGHLVSYQYGCDISSAGDVNKDGYDDVIIGESYAYSGEAGRSDIFFGGNLMDNVSDVNFTGASPNDQFGWSVSGGGDVNRDGYDDMIVGANNNSAGGNQAGRVYVYTCHVSTLIGILNPGVSIGTKNVWKETGYFNQTATVSNFAGEINAYLASAPKSGNDSYGNDYVNVPVNVNASGGGKLTLLNLGITYSYNASVPDFGAILNDYLVSHKNEKDVNGNIKVPIKIRSQCSGRIKLSGLDFTPDKSPAFVKEIGTAELFEDSWNTSLIDLYPCFQDDVDPDKSLDFSVASSTNSSYVKLWISGKRFITADAMTGDSNDNWTGTVEAVVACTDHWGQKTESNKFTIIVKNVNDEPVITSIPITTAEAGIAYYYNITAIDGDNDTLHFSLSKAPANMTIDDKTGKIQWMPSIKGDFMVSLLVSDGIANAMQNFTISVPNKAPRITSSPPLNVTTGVQYIYNVTAEDDNLDALEFSFTSMIEGMTIDSLNGTITWTPQYPGSANVTAWVSDGKERADQRFTINVIQGNRAPRFTNKAGTSATVGLAYTYSPKATDEDGDILSFSLGEGPDGMVINDATGKVDWIPAISGNFSVKIKVNDGRGGDAVQAFVINVADRVKAKVAIDRPSENEKVKGKVTVSGTAVRGTLKVMSVQVRIDNAEWTNATGNYTWEFVIDTIKLKNGKHTIEGRAFDGKDYSDIITVNFTVDNQKAQGKGFIPGFEIGILMLVIVSILSLRFRRVGKNKEEFE